MKKHLLLLSCLFLYGAVVAQDRLFTYTYQSGVLNKGQREIEIWNTGGFGRENFYRAYHNRVEFEVGLGSKVQTAFYLNVDNESTFDPDQAKIIDSPTGISFSNEWKWKVLDPVANPVGLAFYGELGFSTRDFELETKIILDKQIGRTMHALNFVFEPEFEAEVEDKEVENEFETKLELNYAFAYQLNNHWNIGFEVLNANLVKPQNDRGTGGWVNSALFAGLGLSYFTDQFWLNFTLLPQITALHQQTPGTRYPHLSLNDYQRLEARLVFSYAF